MACGLRLPNLLQHESRYAKQNKTKLISTVASSSNLIQIEMLKLSCGFLLLRFTHQSSLISIALRKAIMSLSSHYDCGLWALQLGCFSSFPPFKTKEMYLALALQKQLQIYVHAVVSRLKCVLVGNIEINHVEIRGTVLLHLYSFFKQAR